MNSPRNTSKDDPMMILMDAMIMGTSGAIERQEARGQRELVNSEVLPTKMRPPEFRTAIEEAGGKVLDAVKGDDLFTNVTLPAGWKKESTDHSMWSKLVDEKGRERASIFYKAAFYDRDAFLNGNTRFGIGRDYDRKDEGGRELYYVTDGGVRQSQEFAGARKSRENGWRSEGAELADAWLTEHYPDWRNPGAYWDA